MNNRSYLFAILLVCVAIFIPNLEVIRVNIMEARNFISAREMLDYGNWIKTTMNLEPRYEKPPLPTWITAFFASIFGTKDLFGLRLPAVFSVMFLIFTFYYFAVDLLNNKKEAFISALILSSSFYIIFNGRNGTWDIFAHSFMLFAIFQLYKIFESDRIKWKNWILAGIFLGLSFMSKGPVSHFALLLPFLIAYGIVFTYKDTKFKWQPFMAGMALFILIGFTWGIYIFFNDNSSAHAIAEKETSSWAGHNVRPFYYYWSFFTQSGIWTLFAFISLLYPFMIKRVENKKVYKFSFLWTVISVVLLSLIPEKKARYLMPVLIPLALNTGFYINYLIKNTKTLLKIDRGIANFGFGLIAFIGIIFPLAGYLFLKGNLEGFWLSFILTSITLFLIGVLILMNLRKSNYEKAFYGLIAFICGITIFAFPMAKVFYDNDEFLSLSTLRKIDAMESVPLYSTDTYIAPELMFELSEPIQKVTGSDELPGDQPFGLLVKDTIPNQIKNDFKVKFVEQFDENQAKKGKRGHKPRRTIKLYLLEK